MSASVRPPALPLAPLQYGANQLLLDPAFPTEADYANVLDDQVFVDTQNGNVLRMKVAGEGSVWPSPYPLIWLNM